MQSKNLNNTALIDLGATNTRFALADNRGHLFYNFRVKTQRSEARVIKSLIEGLEKLKKEASFNKIGFSVAGPVKQNKVYLTNVTGNYVDLVGPLEKVFNLPVSIINDCAGAVLAEKEIGLGKGKESVVYITISSGLGAGVIRNNKLLWFSSIKEEPGHIRIDSKYGLMCRCGGVGHWEKYTSGLYLPQFFKAWNKKRGKRTVPIKYSDVFKLFRQHQKGDTLVIEFFDEVGKISAKAIDMVAKKYQPEVIVLGGSVAQNNKDVILGGIEKHRTSSVPIVFTNLGDEICLLGAFFYANKVEKIPIIK